MIKLNMDKSTRPVRSRKHSRRSWTPVQGELSRPIKRLFTPEIKRMLKDWLVRRRENPYPSRDEKKHLAQKTGLTYIQICNWFANWRRKLKNAGNEPQKNTWGNLIKNYNNNARGNVEQFSICSSDSIWEDEERRNEYIESKIAIAHRNAENSSQPPIYLKSNLTRFDQSAYENPLYKHKQSKCDNDEPTSDQKNTDVNYSNEQCYQLARTKFWIDSQVDSTNSIDDNNNKNHTTSTSGNNITRRMKSTVKQIEIESKSPPLNCFSNPKYKNQIMEKYLSTLDNKGKCELELSKWLESAAKFTPDKSNYIEWNSKKICSKPDDFQEQYVSGTNIDNIHQKDELDAAEALTFLAGNFKSRLIK